MSLYDDFLGGAEGKFVEDEYEIDDGGGVGWDGGGCYVALMELYARIGIDCGDPSFVLLLLLLLL